jgi:hypothetical protein
VPGLTTSRVLLGYQGNGGVVGQIASDGFPLRQTHFTDAYLHIGGLTLNRGDVARTPAAR